MNPNVSMATHFKYKFEKNKVWQLTSIVEVLNKWKEDYDLMLEIDKTNKCEFCKTDLHWIYKLQCPHKVFKEGYKFKSLYESLVYTVSVAKLNKICLNLGNEFNSLKHNEDFLEHWEKRLGELNKDYNNLFFQLSYKLKAHYNEEGKLIYINPIEDVKGEYDFEICISADAFQGVFYLYRLLEKDYPNGSKYFEM